jgi:2-amino-4-hydroxy-6-hydroxymethyldihydropteridine diphosphokinase
MPEVAYLSLGSNVGDRRANLQSAINRLNEIGTVNAVSGFYETEPVELVDQPWFLNCVVALETGEAASGLLKKLLAIEQEMGRVRLRNKGPRVIDMDILLIGDQVIEDPGLTIPHPAIQERRFVLEPLAEIAPGVRHPVLRKTAREMLSALPGGPIVRRLSSPPD